MRKAIFIFIAIILVAASIDWIHSWGSQGRFFDSF